MNAAVEVDFVEMNLEHLPQVLDIEQLSFPTPWSHHAFVYEIMHNNFSYYIVALAGDKVVAYGGMWLVLDEAHVTNVAVHPQYRNQKIGHVLMHRLMAKAVEKGAARMTLEVRPSNLQAKKLYAGLGFKERGVRKNYYSDTNEDAVIMWNDNLIKEL